MAHDQALLANGRKAPHLTRGYATGDLLKITGFKVT